MTWLLAERSRVMRFHDADRDTLADVFRAYTPGLVAWLRQSPLDDDRADAREHAPSALEIDDMAVETMRRAFLKEERLAFDGPSPYATALTPIARGVARTHPRADAAMRRRVDDKVPGAWRGMAIPRVLHEVVADFSATLSPSDRAVFDLRFASDLPRRFVAERLGVSPVHVRERELHLRRLLFDAIARLVDENAQFAGRVDKGACTAFRGELARLLIEGDCKRCAELLVHLRVCAACHTLYDDFAIIEPSDAVLEGAGGFRPDVDMDVPPRLRARVTSVLPDDASEEVPWYARVSGHVVSTVALTLAAFVAIAIVTSEDEGKKSAHVIEKPLVTLRVACVIGEGQARTVSVVDESLRVSPEQSVRHDCPRGASLALTAKSNVKGRVLVHTGERVAFGPDPLDGESMRALSGTLPLTAAPGGTVALRLVFVAGDVDDAIVIARAEHPLPQDVVVERTVRVSEFE